jgi:hypothetical protein
MRKVYKNELFDKNTFIFLQKNAKIEIFQKGGVFMKRIQAACLEQTIHFALKEALPHAEALRLVEAEYSNYLAQLDRSRTVYQILEKTGQPDGSLLVKLKKQYNSYPYGAYMEESGETKERRK